MNEPKIIMLAQVGRVNGLEFRFAELWDDAPSLPIVVIQSGARREIRMRMDLYKRVFIDHDYDSDTDNLIRKHSSAVWEAITQAPAASVVETAQG